MLAIYISTWRMVSLEVTRRSALHCGVQFSWLTTWRRKSGSCAMDKERPLHNPFRPTLTGIFPDWMFVRLSIRLGREHYSTNSGIAIATVTGGERPDGHPLTLQIGTTPEDRERDDLFRKNMQTIGVRVEFVNRRWAELAKMAREGQLQLWMVGNVALTGDAMMLSLYGPNAGGTNLARFRNAEFDELYRQSKRVASDAERASF